MPRSLGSDPEFRADVVRKLRQVLVQFGLSKAAAARKLGKSRQAFDQYLKDKEKGGTTPSAPTLAKAAQEWGLSFTFRGVSFPGSAFRPKEKTHTPKSQLQLKLFGEPEIQKDGRLLLKIGSKGTKEPELTIEIGLIRREETGA